MKLVISDDTLNTAGLVHQQCIHIAQRNIALALVCQPEL
jgi:hypothetical protein